LNLEVEKLQSSDIQKFPLPILLYDSECPLCTRFKQGLERLPGTSSITMESIHNDDVYLAFPELNKERCKNEVHLINENREVKCGPDVVFNLISRFPGVEKLSWLLDSEMGKQATAAFYHAVNKCKETIKKHCHTCK